MTCIVVIETDSEDVAGPVLSEATLETLAFSRGLGDQIDALVVGSAAPLLERLGEFGVHTVHEANDSHFEAYAPGAWASAAIAAVEASGATVLLAPGSPRGNELMAHVAARQNVLMAANAVEIDQVQPLQVSRQVFGGTALEVMQLSDQLGVLTMAGHACSPTPADTTTSAQISALQVQVSDADLAVRVARTEEGAPDESGSLKSAKVVIGAGRGVGSADGFNELLEMTDLLGASLGVSRVVTSLGWRPHHEQVGQTGSRISPDLYVPCGISGAIQHWAGCSSAKTILAINSDPDAPMVTRAHYAVIGDLHEIVPAINEEIKTRQG
ncbi:MAG: electron transfer flavoprotein subunit alpha/FixB family protein [Ornithinimicrobium sp.]